MVKICKTCKKEFTGKAKHFCSNECKFNNIDYNKTRGKIKEPLNPLINIKSKLDGSIFTDYKNYSGVLTRHLNINNIHTDDIFSHFDIIEIEPKPIKYRCKYCTEWTLHVDFDSGGAITKHLKNTHGISNYDHIKNFPEESHLFKVKRLLDKIEFEKDDNSFVECKICGKKLKRISGTHLKQHGLTPTEYRKIHGSTISNNLKKTIQHNYASNTKLIDNPISVSKDELEIANYIKQYHDIESNTFKFGQDMNIDIYIPELKIAIEYCGLYYHSELSTGRGKEYHLNKLNRCNEHGVRLITIFADEYNENKSLVYHKLDHLLHIGHKQTIHARKCIIKEVNSKECKPFLNKHHLQGFASGSVKLGAYINSKLVSVFILSKPRHTTKFKYTGYELVRFATDVEYKIPGIVGKFISYVKRYHEYIDDIYSYADRRWTDISNNIYLNNKFILSKISTPNYWYSYKHRTREHRTNFQKYKLIEQGYDSKLTEREIMINRGYDIIWDCGTLLYTLHL